MSVKGQLQKACPTQAHNGREQPPSAAVHTTDPARHPGVLSGRGSCRRGWRSRRAAAALLPRVPPARLGIQACAEASAPSGTPCCSVEAGRGGSDVSRETGGLRRLCCPLAAAAHASACRTQASCGWPPMPHSRAVPHPPAVRNSPAGTAELQRQALAAARATVQLRRLHRGHLPAALAAPKPHSERREPQRIQPRSQLLDLLEPGLRQQLLDAPHRLNPQPPQLGSLVDRRGLHSGRRKAQGSAFRCTRLHGSRPSWLAHTAAPRCHAHLHATRILPCKRGHGDFARGLGQQQGCQAKSH